MKWAALMVAVASLLCLGRIWQRLHGVTPTDERRRLSSTYVTDDWLSDHFRREGRWR